MGKKTIGEAVDGEVGLAALREIGVDFAQGHWLSPPGPFLAEVSAGMARTGTDSAPKWAVPAPILNSTS
jgi:EAL domain-containing protein (putative c-di-GMP-specific phosphodiesterase class I)